MTEILLDTSSIIHLSLFLKKENQWGNIIKHPEVYTDTTLNAVSNLIESFVLYDKLYVDGVSYNENAIKIDKHTFSINNLVEQINIDRREELDIYDSIYITIKKLFEEKGLKLISSCEEMNFAIFVRGFMSTASTGNYKSKEFNDKVESIYNLIYPYYKLAGIEPLFANININFVRLFYYMELQKRFSKNLFLHPEKKLIMKTFDIESINPLNLGENILNNFLKSRNKKIDNLQSEWIKCNSVSYKAPLLFEYIINKSTNREDLLSVIAEVRNSKKAIAFRSGLNELEKAILKNDVKVVEEVLENLEYAKKEWNKNMKFNPDISYRDISISIPFIGGLGTDLKIPFPKRIKKTSDKLLTFIHEIRK